MVWDESMSKQSTSKNHPYLLSCILGCSKYTEERSSWCGSGINTYFVFERFATDVLPTFTVSPKAPSNPRARTVMVVIYRGPELCGSRYTAVNIVFHRIWLPNLTIYIPQHSMVRLVSRHTAVIFACHYTAVHRDHHCKFVARDGQRRNVRTTPTLALPPARAVSVRQHLVAQHRIPHEGDILRFQQGSIPTLLQQAGEGVNRSLVPSGHEGSLVDQDLVVVRDAERRRARQADAPAEIELP